MINLGWKSIEYNLMCIYLYDEVFSVYHNFAFHNSLNLILFADIYPSEHNKYINE